MNTDIRIVVLGLGYVGLPLSQLYATRYSVVGIDIHQQRIKELHNGFDATLEVAQSQLQAVLLEEIPFKKNTNGLFCSSNIEDIQGATIYIVTVPTPADQIDRPDLRPLRAASETTASVLKQGDVDIYESTVYTGVMQEECVSVLEQYSGLK